MADVKWLEESHKKTTKIMNFQQQIVRNDDLKIIIQVFTNINYLIQELKKALK